MMKRSLFAVIACLIGVPALVYAVGSAVLGPYEGESGFLGFLGSIYADAVRADVSALVLLFSPLLLAAIWWVVFRVRRSMPA